MGYNGLVGKLFIGFEQDFALYPGNFARKGQDMQASGGFALRSGVPGHGRSWEQGC